MGYVRVTIKAPGGKRKSFWAEKLGKSSSLTRYRRVNNEGDDFGYYRKDGVFIDKQDLVANRLIISEKKAVMDKKYGTLKVVK